MECNVPDVPQKSIYPKLDWVHYLQCIDAPAKEFSMIYKIMNRALKMKAVWKLPTIVCVSDLSIFAKNSRDKTEGSSKVQRLYFNARDISYHNDVHECYIQTIQRCWIMRYFSAG